MLADRAMATKTLRRFRHDAAAGPQCRAGGPWSRPPRARGTVLYTNRRTATPSPRPALLLCSTVAGALLLSACTLTSGEVADAPSGAVATAPGAAGSPAAEAGAAEVTEAGSAEPAGEPSAVLAAEDVPPAEPPAPITLAFAGDTHTTGSAGVIATEGLGPVAELLRAADVSVVNLETAVVSSDGAQAAPKQYTFSTSPSTLAVLAADGVDAVSMANNHGMDFGTQGLADSLGAAEAATDIAVLGIGEDLRGALRPFVTEVGGRTVGVMAANDVLDSFALDVWPATADSPGMASTKGDAEEGVLATVRQLDADVDVAVVVMHWGVEREVCPTARQQELARALLGAGADVVVGSHAHVVQPVTTIDGRTVAYGLGNFGWYTNRSPSNRTGVLTVTIDPEGGQSTAWQPATISGGRPVPEGAVVPVPDVTGCATG